MQLKDAKLFRQQAYVDDIRVDADNGQTIKVNNPATGEIIGSTPKMGAAETRRTIEAVDEALPAWCALTVKECANKLHRRFGLMIENQGDLARLMTIRQDKLLAEAKSEIAYATSFLEWFGEGAKRIYSDTTPSHQLDKRIIVIKQPIGMTATITPWNFPSAVITRRVSLTLTAGCTMMLKPASQTPYSTLVLAKLAGHAGIPKGVSNVVTGSAGEVSDELISSPIVRKLTFIGSTEVGRQLMTECAQDTKKVSLELSGNAPFTMLDDVDLDATVEGALISRYRNNGQTYVCANRLYVQDGTYDVFVDKLKAAVAKLNIGNGLEVGVTAGPLIDAKAVTEVEEYIADAVSKGARMVPDGKLHALGDTFFEPTILVDMLKNALVSKDEAFGPLVPVFRFKDEARAIATSNDIEFGLASYFYARNLACVSRVVE